MGAVECRIALPENFHECSLGPCISDIILIIMFNLDRCRDFVHRRIGHPGSWHDQDPGTHAPLHALVMSIKCAVSLRIDLAHVSDSLSDCIMRFQQQDGHFHDPSIQDSSHQLGETRQVIAALKALGKPTRIPTIHWQKEFDSLSLGDPWGACARLSHIAYLSHAAGQTTWTKLAIDHLMTLRAKDGLWGPKAVTPSHRINATMKAIVALRTVDADIKTPWSALAYLLRHAGPEEGCHECDRAIVLNTLLRNGHGVFRWLGKTEAKRMAERIHQRQFPDGGFSYFPGHCQTHFYGTEISKPLNQGDVHGTHLMLWALYELGQLVGNPLPLNPPPV